jgi:hypothetical protein
MKLTLVIENVKDSSKKTKRAMFVIYEDKKGQKEYAASEITKDHFLYKEFDNIVKEMEELIKEKKKLAKVKNKVV